MHLLSALATSPYSVCYLLGVAIPLVAAGRRAAGRRTPLGAWAAAAVSAIVAGTIGARTLSLDGHSLPANHTTVLGALLLGGTTFAIAAWTLGLDTGRELDAATSLAPIGMAVGRIGCFLAGCCFGIPTTLPLGVRYLPGSDPFLHQVALGLIAPSARGSVPVHPTQLYEAVLDVIVVFAVARVRRRMSRPGSRALATISGLCGVRFVVDPLRASSIDAGWLTAMQWSMLLVAAVSVGWLVWRERSPSVSRTLAAIGTRAQWLRARVGAPSAVVALLPMQIGVASPDTSYPRRYFAIGPSAMAGTYREVATNCDGGDLGVRDHTFSTVGVDAELGEQTGITSGYALHLDGFVGNDMHRAGQVPRGWAPNNGVSASFDYDAEYGGVTAGVVAGQLSTGWLNQDGRDATQQLFPKFGIRAGSLNGLFLEAGTGTLAPAPTPVGLISADIGLADPLRLHTFRLGISDGGAFASLSFRSHDWEFEPLVMSNLKQESRFGLTVHRYFRLDGK